MDCDRNPTREPMTAHVPDAPNVLQVLTCDGVGGTESMVAALVERMDRTAVRSDVAILDAPGPVAARLARNGIGVRSLGGAGLAIAAWRLARLLRKGRFDV